MTTRKEILAAIKGLKKGDFEVNVKIYSKNDAGEYHWLFNWVEGGHNDVWAKTRIAAIRKVTGSLTPDPSSFRKCGYAF